MAATRSALAVPDLRWQSVAAASETIDAWIARTSPDERVQARRYRHEIDQHRYLVGRALARTMMAHAIGRHPLALRIECDDRGKPHLVDDSRISFNISHSGDLVMVAVSRGRTVGVDVEQHRTDIDVAALGRVVFTDAELGRIMEAAPENQIPLFFRQWVFKEALVKALGTGLLKDPKRFQIGPGRVNPVIEFVGQDPDDVGEGWHMRVIDVPPGYSACLCVQNPLTASQDAILAA